MLCYAMPQLDLVRCWVLQNALLLVRRNVMLCDATARPCALLVWHARSCAIVHYVTMTSSQCGAEDERFIFQLLQR
jgi:hypothetical protein